MHRLSFLALASVFSVQVLAASVHPRSLAPPGWESVICLKDGCDFGYPLLIGPGYADPAGMTIEKCAAFCGSQQVPYRFMGLTDGFQCSCDNFFEYIFESDPGSCNTPCPGNPLEVGGCGGMELSTPLASTYQRVDFTFPALVPSVGQGRGWEHHCGVLCRRMSGPMILACGRRIWEGMLCVHFLGSASDRCGSQLQHGSTFFGNNNGIEHGNFRQNPNVQNCNMACQGDPTELCGGPALLNLYNFTGTYPIGASVVTAAESDSPSSRALERRVDAGNVTVESCVSACQSQSFTIAGLKYAQECLRPGCGDEIKPPRGPIPQSACNQACIGDNTGRCEQLSRGSTKRDRRADGAGKDAAQNARRVQRSMISRTRRWGRTGGK
ncbi:hypothetical protein BJY52DRAFT_1227860 [Lactarius psammicola]|nr:hypothetical protein BJY52DRAFT_1227860 [Lactarius psammicola]